MSDSDTTILLDSYESLGSVEAKLTNLAKNHEVMETEVDELKALRQKFGGVILTLSVFWGLICAGFVYFSDVIKAKLPH